MAEPGSIGLQRLFGLYGSLKFNGNYWRGHTQYDMQYSTMCAHKSGSTVC